MDTLSIFKISWRYFHHDAISRLLNELYDSIGVVLCSLEILFGVWSLSSIVWFFKRTGSHLNRLSSYKQLSAINLPKYIQKGETHFTTHRNHKKMVSSIDEYRQGVSSNRVGGYYYPQIDHDKQNNHTWALLRRLASWGHFVRIPSFSKTRPFLFMTELIFE